MQGEDIPRNQQSVIVPTASSNGAVSTGNESDSDEVNDLFKKLNEVRKTWRVCSCSEDTDVKKFFADVVQNDEAGSKYETSSQKFRNEVASRM